MSAARRLVITGFSAIFTFACVIAVIALAALWTFNSPGPKAATGEATTVVLRPGAGLTEISTALERAHVIRSGPVFAAAAQITGAARHLKAGEYEFPSQMSMAKVLTKIRKGEILHHFVSVPEGMTSEMVVDILMGHEELSGSAPVPPEGAILPDTYDVRRGEDRAVVLDRMMAARDKLLDKLWAQRQPGLPLKTPEEAVILASIVEKETGKPAERPKIARVFVNRLEKGMRLETDPTIIYGLTRGRPLGRGIRLSEKNTPTPYNTYFINGLPPTPIANAGREALAAVMNPPQGDWLYFVADGAGGSLFSTTLDEQSANVAKLRQLEHQRAGQPDAAPMVEDAPPPAEEPAPPAKAEAKPAAKSKHKGR